MGRPRLAKPLRKQLAHHLAALTDGFASRCRDLPPRTNATRTNTRRTPHRTRPNAERAADEHRRARMTSAPLKSADRHMPVACPCEAVCCPFCVRCQPVARPYLVRSVSVCCPFHVRYLSVEWCRRTERRWSRGNGESRCEWLSG